MGSSGSQTIYSWGNTLLYFEIIFACHFKTYLPPSLNYESIVVMFVAIFAFWLFIQENLQQWLTDEKARDQFVIRAGTDTEVLWNDARQLKADPVYKRAVSS